MNHADFYERYIETCNRRQWHDLGTFVAESVQVIGKVRPLEDYVDGLQAVVEAFPDFHWTVEELLVDGDRLAARLTNTGTHRGTFLDVPATGRRISTTELAMYHLTDGKITACWGDLGSTVRNELLSESGEGFGSE
jgi:steroid delta-isomerase-like uncharacterized protein